MSLIHKDDKTTKNGSKSGKTFLQKLYSKFKNLQVSEESKNNAAIIQNPPNLLMSEVEINQQIETQEELQLDKLVKSIILEDMMREDKKRKEEEHKMEKKRLEEERKSIEKIRKKEVEKRKSIEEQRKHQIGSFQCTVCNNLFTSTKDLHSHECECIFCREPFRASILKEHHKECLQRPIPWSHTGHSFSRERDVFQPIVMTNSLIFQKPQGLTKQQIENFPIMNYKNKDKKTNAEEKCAICMEMFLETRKLRVLPCFHNYHVECIDKWLIMQNFCPICKQAMKFY